jgi:hypothetical protein
MAEQRTVPGVVQNWALGILYNGITKKLERPPLTNSEEISRELVACYLNPEIILGMSGPMIQMKPIISSHQSLCAKIYPESDET